MRGISWRIESVCVCDVTGALTADETPNDPLSAKLARFGSTKISASESSLFVGVEGSEIQHYQESIFSTVFSGRTKLLK